MIDQRRENRLFSKASFYLVLTFIVGISCRFAWAQTICALVKLQILQKATMERVAFDAQLGITNSLATSPLTNFGVTISIKDTNGVPADSMFFLKIGTMTSVTGVDGTG